MHKCQEVFKTFNLSSGIYCSFKIPHKSSCVIINALCQYSYLPAQSAVQISQLVLTEAMLQQRNQTEAPPLPGHLLRKAGHHEQQVLSYCLWVYIELCDFSPIPPGIIEG